ncbi:MAG: WecB/TagA/CpsF family glycosyltransferase [Candidatus Berkelbacteria bacterium]|nr:WecB/TagA/CpsF family glycosyltransferase [Candidatus Berkelbacteria bacterium]
MTKRKKVKILNIPIDTFKKSEVLEFLEEKIGQKSIVKIATVNTEFLMTATWREDVRAMLDATTLNLADGVGVLWAAKFLSLKLPKEKFWRIIVGILKLKLSLMAITFYPKYLCRPIPARISGSDFIYDLSKFAAKNSLSLFFLGGEPTVAEQAALKLQTDILNLKVAGTYAGTPKVEDEEKIVEIIKNSQADIIFVAYGVPNEELWINRNLKKTAAKIGIGIGGTFDFLAGRRKRAPRFFRTIGLEWFWRLILEPRRLRRQLALPKFIYQIFKLKIFTN